ncbi:MAG: hypothetical protein K0S54_979 [Alphaproteobacteria bacterium]|jgi:hypothetical protein|nr:hypothetical protein [Alphaproteobacteria bacterium]
MTQQLRQRPIGLKPPRFVLSGGFALLLALGSCTADQQAATSGQNIRSAAAVAPATGGPTRLHNLNSTQIVAMLGEPGFKREENPAQIWRYRSEACVLELMLYRLDRDLQVRHVEARDEKFKAVAQNACIESIVAAKGKPAMRG